jgi:hypothetical protein
MGLGGPRAGNGPALRGRGSEMGRGRVFRVVGRSGRGRLRGECGGVRVRIREPSLVEDVALSSLRLGDLAGERWTQGLAGQVGVQGRWMWVWMEWNRGGRSAVLRLCGRRRPGRRRWCNGRGDGAMRAGIRLDVE